MALKFVHLTIINVGYKVYNQCLFLRILSVGVLDLLASAMCIFKPQRWFSVGKFKYKPGYNPCDLL